MAGTLQVRVLEGRQLLAADVGGTSDPYAKLRIGKGPQYKTKHINKTLNPKWNETFRVTVAGPDTDVLDIEIYDRDVIGKDDYLGGISIPLHSLIRGEEKVQWYKLNKVATGEVLIGITAENFGIGERPVSSPGRGSGRGLRGRPAPSAVVRSEVPVGASPVMQHHQPQQFQPQAMGPAQPQLNFPVVCHTPQPSSGPLASPGSVPSRSSAGAAGIGMGGTSSSGSSSPGGAPRSSSARGPTTGAAAAPLRPTSWGVATPKPSLARRDSSEIAGKARMKVIFDEFDTDGSGYISASELRASLKKRFNLELDHDNALLLLQRCDDNNDGKISFDEFCTIIDVVLEMKKEFEIADVDRSNAINANELHKVMARMNLNLAPNLVAGLVRIFDDDQSGEIEYQEFFNLILFVRELEYQFNKRLKDAPSSSSSGAKMDVQWVHKMLGHSMSSDPNLLRYLSSNQNHAFDSFVEVVLHNLQMNRSAKKAPRIMKLRKERKKAPVRQLTRRPTMLQNLPAQVKLLKTGTLLPSASFINPRTGPVQSLGSGQIYSIDRPFVDPDFPPSYQSIGSRLKGRVTCWKRPRELAPNPELIVDGVEEGDVVQGLLGDCWFLGALSVVATSGSELIQQLFVESNFDAGRHLVRFFKNGDWVVVEIDDLIPCTTGGKMAFASCRDRNEFWVPLIEKAYAKLHGSYQNLEAGSISYGLKDLTGEAVEVVRLDELETLPDEAQRNPMLLWPVMVDNIKESFLMGCSIMSSVAMAEEKNEFGLLLNHAYGIIDCQEVQGNKLIRLRNPWGNYEWNGRWSDGSKEWTPALMRHFGSYEFDNDGTFFMCWEDFCKFFNSIHILRMLTDDVGEVWEKHEFSGAWTQASSGGCFNFPGWNKNPQFRLTVNQPGTHIFACISQDDMRYQFRNNPDAKYTYLSMGLNVVQGDSAVASGYRKVSCTSAERLKTSVFVPGRDNSLEFLASKRGDYVLIPSLFQPGGQSQFSLQIYAQYPIRVEELLADMPKDEIQSAWTAETAGGCMNHGSWWRNPQFVFQSSAAVSVTFALQQEGPSPEVMGMYLFDGGQTKNGKFLDVMGKSLTGMPKFSNVPDTSVVYQVAANHPVIVMPCTFEPGKLRRFSVSAIAADSSVRCSFRQVADWPMKEMQGQWAAPKKCGGCMGHPSWMDNPFYRVQLSSRGGGGATCQVSVFLDVGDNFNDGIGFYLLQDSSPLSSRNVVAKVNFLKNNCHSGSFAVPPGNYVLLPCTYTPGTQGSFKMVVFCEPDFNLAVSPM